MMRPKDLIENAYVLRRDSDVGPTSDYQRMIVSSRIKKVRKFVLETKKTFLNNIIVSLPDDVEFKKLESISHEGQKTFSRSSINPFQDPQNGDPANGIESYKITIPKQYNSIAIIDGQHRVYSFFEDNVDPNDTSSKKYLDECEIAKLRSQLSLLVTGLYFDPTTWSDSEKRRFESRLFCEINQNAKSVDEGTLLAIEEVGKPFTDHSVAMKTLRKLNETTPFDGRLRFSDVGSHELLSIPSIIKYSLSSFVRPSKKPNTKRNQTKTLFSFWADQNNFIQEEFDDSTSDEDINSYVNYCVNLLSLYFGAIKSVFPNDWKPKSKLLTVFSINAFIIAARNTMQIFGPKDKDFYEAVITDARDRDGLRFSPPTDPTIPNSYSSIAGSKYRLYAKKWIIPAFERQNQDSNLFSMK